MIRRQPLGRPREGFSLLEIILALAILGGSLAILSRIVDRGASAAREARDLSIARILCQTKLTEILLDGTAGISPQSTPPAPMEAFDSEAITAFEYQVDVVQAPMEGLLALRVTVTAINPNNVEIPLARYSLSRWMIDPLLGLEAAEAEEEAAKEAAEAEAAI